MWGYDLVNEPVQNTAPPEGMPDYLGAQVLAAEAIRAIDPERPIILHVGRLDTDKRVEIVVRAAAKVMKKIDAQLLVIGDGEHHEGLVNQAQQLGIGKRSHFPGFVSPTGDLPDLYRLATVFATASEIETQGLVLLEALASGLPVVAVDATCIPELVIDGENGFLVSPRDTDAMADRLGTIISNPSLAEQMGRVGCIVVQEHSSTTALNKHEVLYQELHAQRDEMPERIPFINRYKSFFRQLPRIELRGKDH